jgi:DNA-binding response OmpR family regulator
MPLILLVGADAESRSLLQRALQRAGFATLCATSGQQALAVLASARPNLLMLDESLPDLDSLQVVAQAQVTRDLPVLLCNTQDEEASHIARLAAGADVVLDKPIRVNEVIAYVRALLRRSERLRTHLASNPGPPPPVLRHGELIVMPASQSASLHGLQLNLSASEFKLLLLLMSNPGQLFSRADLLHSLWPNRVYVPGERSMDNLVLRLRRKLGDDGREIETVWGAGYRLRPCASTSPTRTRAGWG